MLAWFPHAYTRGCTIECKSLAEHGDMITQYDVAYFMISVDPLDARKSTGNSSSASRTRATVSCRNTSASESRGLSDGSCANSLI